MSLAIKNRATIAALASLLATPSVKRSCPRGSGGLAPAKGANDRRKKRKAQKLARRKQR